MFEIPPLPMSAFKRSDKRKPKNIIFLIFPPHNYLDVHPSNLLLSSKLQNLKNIKPEIKAEIAPIKKTKL